MIHAERIHRLNAKPTRPGRYVLYWMQASQRAEYNHALEYAIREANGLSLPVLAVFGLTGKYPEANERHYAFMLEGLRETRQALRKRGVELVIRETEPDDAALQLAPDAAIVVTDRGYTSIQRRWRRTVARRSPGPVVQVETDVVVPAEVASGKAEYAARTLRPKIHKHLSEYLVPLERTRLKRDSLGMMPGAFDIEDTAAVLGRLRVDRSAPWVRAFAGGTSRAKTLLREFLRTKLKHYADGRNEPSRGIQSHQSPYLHFGQVSPLYIALEAMDAAGSRREALDAYLEELIVRRELAINFVQHCGRYRSYRCLPSWAAATLHAHQKDRRPVVYTLAQLERAQTHDPYWNAAMREMLVTGKMHNYMRMYWGKKILEWTRRPQTAFRWALYLNNKYFLDGRDPNSWASVAWCFGLHDRPWGKRPVFGTVRYMNAAGLERKFDMDEYLRMVGRLS